MRSLKTLLYATALLAGLSTPAVAGTWSEDLLGQPTYTGITHELTTPSTGQTTAARFYYRSDSSPQWMICQQVDNDDSTVAFDTNGCSHFANGTRFTDATGVCRTTTTLGTSTLSIRWLNAGGGNFLPFGRDRLYEYLPWEQDTAPTRLTRTEISTGRPPRATEFANFPDSYWYDPACPGTGLFMEIQGDRPLILFYGYAANGQNEWRLATGAFTTSTLGSFDFNRCTKSGSTVACQSEGSVTVELVTVPANTDTQTPASYRVRVRYPSGRTETLSRYRF